MKSKKIISHTDSESNILDIRLPFKRKLSYSNIVKFLPLLIILMVWVIFAYPYFSGSKVPYPSSYQVNGFQPWSAYKEFWGPVKNAAMPDVINQIYPWKHFTVSAMKEGRIPFWNPYSFAGTPHLANYQSAVYSPLTLIFLIFPFLTAWTIQVLLQPLLAGIFSYLLLKEQKVSALGAVAGSIVFMFSGYMVVWMAYGTLAMTGALLPLLIFIIERYLNTKKISLLFLLSIIVAVCFFSGHFQTSFYVISTAILYAVYKLVTTKRLKNILLLFISILVGILFALPQLLPTITLYMQSPRSEIINHGGGIPLQYLVTVIAPDFFGNPVTRNEWFGYYAEFSGFIGITALIFGIIAVFGKRRQIVAFYGVLGIVSLILAAQTPLLQIIADLKIPVLSTSTPSRIIFIFSFCFAMLAGFGIDAVKESIDKKQRKKILFVFTTVGFSFVAIWTALLVLNILPEDKTKIAINNFLLPSMIFIGLVVAVIPAYINRKYMFILFLVVILSVSFDSLRFVKKWIPQDPATLVFPKNEVITTIKSNIGYGRLFGNTGAHIDTYYQIPTLEGYDPLYIKSYGEFIRSSSTGIFTPPERSIVRIDRTSKHTERLLDFLGVTLILHPNEDTNEDWAYPVWEKKEKYQEIFHDRNFQVFRNKDAMERVRIYYDYQLIPNEKSLIQTFFRDDFDFRETLLLREDPKIEKIPDETIKSSAKIISYQPEKVTIRTVSEREGLLLLTDPDYIKWKVQVNGKQSKIFTANHAFRAVVIPKGKSEVIFYYQEYF